MFLDPIAHALPSHLPQHVHHHSISHFSSNTRAVIQQVTQQRLEAMLGSNEVLPVDLLKSATFSETAA